MHLHRVKLHPDQLYRTTLASVDKAESDGAASRRTVNEGWDDPSPTPYHTTLTTALPLAVMLPSELGTLPAAATLRPPSSEDCDSYCKASKGKLKINMKKYCKKDYAVQIHILKADKAGDWWKFTVNIISVYKQGTNRIRRGDQILWIRSKDIACKCPKIKPMKKYLLLGNDEDSPDQNGIVADKSSLVIQWRDTWARRLRKFQQREKKGKCKKA
ncbi:Netrin-1 [Chelonia mydas]|uniref:Netrin-1 n=1 Tax=Chelonia mydas TaxID=8469 RepID=M7AVC0_CHEMY|nr:Netrin-1 [Chelonia mydas]